MPATALFAELLDVVLNYLFVHGSAQGSLTQILRSLASHLPVWLISIPTLKLSLFVLQSILEIIECPLTDTTFGFPVQNNFHV